MLDTSSYTDDYSFAGDTALFLTPEMYQLIQQTAFFLEDQKPWSVEEITFEEDYPYTDEDYYRAVDGSIEDC